MELFADLGSVYSPLRLFLHVFLTSFSLSLFVPPLAKSPFSGEKEREESERVERGRLCSGNIFLAGLLPVQTSQMGDNTNIGVIMSLLNESIAP